MLHLRGATLPPWPLTADMWNYIPPGVWWLCLALLGAWSTDTGAFHIGKAFGIRVHPLLPRISPGKNIEGLIGGTIFATVTCLLIGSLLLHLPWYLCLLLGIILGPCSLAGDLSESLIKREAHAKDSGTIMPGHGGILDRCDSILFGVIIVYTFMLIIG
ncbi:phosphatidate cytidylyltransferase [Ktedonobacter robiniae]